MGECAELIAYKKAFKLAMDVFEISKQFPSEEKYVLSCQIRRSSRSVCANIAEAYERRNYIKHFKAKLFGAACENSETRVWLHFGISCKYLSMEHFTKMVEENRQIGSLLKFMINNPEKFL